MNSDEKLREIIDKMGELSTIVKYFINKSLY